MVNPGEIYWAEIEGFPPRPVIVISREALNRGLRVVVIPLTTAQFEKRRNYPNCIAFAKDEFGLSRDCVAQAEKITVLERTFLGEVPLGQLDEIHLRAVVRAIGYVIEAECEPA